MATSVDLSGSIRFDLQSGAVHIGDDEKGVVVPADVLKALVANAPSEVRARVGRSLGAYLGRGVVRRAAGATALLGSGLEHAASLLAAELALAGLGSCNLERWGRALVVHMVGAPSVAPDFLVSVIEGALAASTGRAVYCALLSEADGVRVLVASEQAAIRVRGWLDEGTSFGDALVRLQRGAS
jgi:hypothetical protein